MRLLHIIFLFLIFKVGVLFSDPWIAYGTVVIPPYEYQDNPPLSQNGLLGEVERFPYTVPQGYKLTINFIQVEGPTGPQFGMMLWVGSQPVTNAQGIISCTTIGGSTQLHGMQIVIPSGKTLNIRCMNNTGIAWANGFFIMGSLDPE